MSENSKQTDDRPGATSRRTFLDILLGVTALAWLGSVIYPVFRFLLPPKQPALNLSSLNAGPLEAFEINSSKIIRFGRNPVILIREKSGKMKAFSAKCTHLDCNVQYKDDTEQIWCACHNGLYDLEGRNISGPPPRPLQRYTVSVVKDEIILSKSEGA